MQKNTQKVFLDNEAQKSFSHGKFLFYDYFLNLCVSVCMYMSTGMQVSVQASRGLQIPGNKLIGNSESPIMDPETELQSCEAASALNH